MLDLLARFATPADRQAAADAVARTLGADELYLFAPDPELDVLLPAPGLPQTLRPAQPWRQFLARCREAGELTDTLHAADGRVVHVHGVATPDGSVAVATGAAAAEADLAPLRTVLPLLGALFTVERRAESAEVRISAAAQAVERAGALTSALQRMRERLETALSVAETARMEASDQAAESEQLAEELRLQSADLEEQAAQLEELNQELGRRSSEAEEARRAAETANRAKSEFLATMSHELRTPVNAIIGYTEILDMGIAGDITPDQRRQLNRVASSSRHLLTLINDVLDLAKIEAGHMAVRRRPAWAERPISDAIALLALQASERGVFVVNECEGADVEFVGDEDRVRQVLVNLLSNAVKFTHEGGQISVRCGTREQAPAESALSGDGAWTFVEVEDTGIGMSAEEIATVFRPFVQAESGRTRSTGGTGLGLTISRQLARLMGGDLTVQSTPGTGSRFRLWLPSSTAVDGTLDESIRVGIH